LKCLKQHAVTEIGGCYRLLLVYPRTVKRTAFGINDALCIYILYPTRPYHTESSRSRAEQIRAIGDHVWFNTSVFRVFTAPWAFTRLEHQFTFSLRTTKIRF